MIQQKENIKVKTHKEYVAEFELLTYDAQLERIQSYVSEAEEIRAKINNAHERFSLGNHARMHFKHMLTLVDRPYYLIKYSCNKYICSKTELARKKALDEILLYIFDLRCQSKICDQDLLIYLSRGYR